MLNLQENGCWWDHFILLYYADVQCPRRLMWLDSSRSLLSVCVCMNLGFQMLLYMSKNLSIDFSNKRKCKIPHMEAELQVCLNSILALAGS